jgi:small subunit ribosomal protein S19
MKIPWIDYDLYTKSSQLGDNIKIKATSRSSTIISKFIGKTFSIHNGKTLDHLTIKSGMVGQKLGAFILTKKLGKSIHNSDHNKKVKEKARRKITQKKVRKTTGGNKLKKSSSKKK